MSKDKDDRPAPGKPAEAAPEKPGSAFFTWLGILGCSTGSLFFNISNDTHYLHPHFLAGLAGFLPPFLTVTLGHSSREVTDKQTKWFILAVAVGAMAVSAKGVAYVLQPAYGLYGGIGFAVVLDGGTLILLNVLIEHYQKARLYKRWLKAQDTRNQSAPSAPSVRAPAREPRTGTTKAAVPGTTLVPAQVTAEPATAIPGTAIAALGSGLHADAKPGHPAQGGYSQVADINREKVVDEIAARRRPAGESEEDRKARAEKILADYPWMNLRQFAKAMVVSKTTAGEIRRAITGQEGEQSAEGEEGVG